MVAVGIKELKNRLSEFVKLASGGEVVLVTDRSRVVAELRAPREPEFTRPQDAIWADWVRRGIVTPARIRDGSPPPRLRLAPTEQILAELDADRADR
jgi:antitoxin (DNA-binding transcriptional repressor) of toxin-antitoxin stability system